MKNHLLPLANGDVITYEFRVTIFKFTLCAANYFLRVESISQVVSYFSRVTSYFLRVELEMEIATCKFVLRVASYYSRVAS